MKNISKTAQQVRKSVLKKYNRTAVYEVSSGDFDMNVERYLQACKQNRLMCVIDSVSKSGMSRTMKFVEMNKGRIFNFYLFFEVMGFKCLRDSDFFRVYGCGMDMVFHTHYTIIRNLYSMGYLTKKQCEVLEQNTPHRL